MADVRTHHISHGLTEKSAAHTPRVWTQPPGAASSPVRVHLMRILIIITRTPAKRQWHDQTRTEKVTCGTNAPSRLASEAKWHTYAERSDRKTAIMAGAPASKAAI